MTFEQLHDLYFSQPGATLDEQALRYFWDSAVAEEREAHRGTIKMAAELLDEIRGQWGQDYLWAKWGLDGQIAAIVARTP